MIRPYTEPSSGGTLLVEGQNDLHTVLHLCNKGRYFAVGGGGGINPYIVTLHSSNSSFTVQEKKSNSELLKSISGEVKVPSRQALGILMDADDDLVKSWNDIGNELRGNGIKVPVNPDPSGTIIERVEGVPRIGVWLMPDNQSPGELENFIEVMIPDNDLVWPLSQRYVDGIPQEGRKFLPNKATKAKVHSWLSARRNPRQIGAAIGAGDLQVNGPLCGNFITWLAKLFG